MQVERIENLLYEKFYRSSKFILPEDASVLTASNDYMFPGLQFLYYSIALSHKANICVIDCGMTDIQREWCVAEGIEVISLMPEDMLFSGTERVMHLWNKCTYVKKCPYKKVLWLDSDCVVRDNLGIFFDLLERGPVFTEDHFASLEVMSNWSTLYMHMPIAPYRRGKVYLNSGVMAFDKERDASILDSWKECVQRATEIKEVMDSIAWHDQGALMWAVEKNGRTDCIRRELGMNYPAKRAGDPWGDAQTNVVGFLESMPNDGCIVRHYLSHPKPWHHWRRGGLAIDLRDSFARKVKVYVLSHRTDLLTRLPNRPYFEKVILDDLPLGKFQTNKLAESRIFLTPSMHRQEHEYIGFASARWNEKYCYLGVSRIEDIYQLKLMLKPNHVLVAQRTDNVNGPLGDLDAENWRTHFEVAHKGIKPFLEELAEISGIDNRNPSFWANNFICHRTVFKDFLKHWLDVFFQLHEKHGFDFNFESIDPRRTAAFLMEAITINYFSSRTDLKIIEATKRDGAYKVL